MVSRQGTYSYTCLTQSAVVIVQRIQYSANSNGQSNQLNGKGTSNLRLHWKLRQGSNCIGLWVELAKRNNYHTGTNLALESMKHAKQLLTKSRRRQRHKKQPHQCTFRDLVEGTTRLSSDQYALGPSTSGDHPAWPRWRH